MNTQEITMNINPENLMKGLKLTFTNQTTYLSEMMQNSRRAGASKVIFEYNPELNALIIQDDGCGIESLEKLLSVAESGWQAEVVEHEHPFGIGFLSALFACDHITVCSKSGLLSSQTEIHSDVLIRSV